MCGDYGTPEKSAVACYLSNKSFAWFLNLPTRKVKSLMNGDCFEGDAREINKKQPAVLKSRLPFYSCQEIDNVRSFAQVQKVMPLRDL